MGALLSSQLGELAIAQQIVLRQACSPKFTNIGKAEFHCHIESILKDKANGKDGMKKFNGEVRNTGG